MRTITRSMTVGVLIFASTFGEGIKMRILFTAVI